MLNYIYLYIIFFIILFSFLKLNKLFKIIFYILSSWLYIYIYIYVYSQELYYLFIKSIWKEELIEMMLLDGQILVTLLMDFSFFLSLFIFVIFIFLTLKIWLFTTLTLKEKIIYILFLNIFIYYFIFSYWIVDQDLGFSIWEFLNYDASYIYLLIEYKPSIDKIYFFFEGEFWDVFVVLFFLFLINILILNRYKIYFYLRRYKNIFISIFLCFSIFFFCGEGFLNDLKILSLSFIFLELWILLFIFLYRIKQKNILNFTLIWFNFNK